MINLYSHNQKAYELVVTMLEDTKKAAIVHPTGTGKSFIAFKLCEDHPDKTICWLSPSEYIFSTQLENLYQATNGYKPHNIVFFTYAKLMGMSKEAIQAIHPDYIILDEYHRAGATFWQKGVEQLLFTYADVPVLGLSATNIRYLDSQRDMAQELFDGNIASQMSLGEAIVRGILNPPKYVLSMYYYQNTLEKYEIRVKKTKSKVVRDQAEKYLDELKRALENADGLDEIFNKHMSDPHGKYIVFCSNKEHMDQMMKHTEWFSKVDKEPHMYSVYSSDPGADKAFKDFKEDTDNNHLRLLYCIDALNEGIHVDDISGVILLRPTVSPIVYKQQIGRALSASKKTNAVIFDIVLNIENLYSIDSVKEEMEVATSYYRSLGESEEIINEKFKIIDEVRNCRELFEKLNDTLTATWDMYYACAKEYFKENRNLEVPARFITEEGYALGSWISNQRAIRKGTTNGRLTEVQIHKLDSIGMIWESYNDLNWSKNYCAAKQYYEEHGNLEVPSRYITEDGISLGNWISSVRKWYSSGVHKKYLQRNRIKLLEDIGMIWRTSDYFWEQNFMLAKAYYKEHGDLDIPSNYTTKDGIQLGSWLGRQRKLYNRTGKGALLTESQINRLESIGMHWTSRVDHIWEKGFIEARNYKEKYGNLDVPVKYKSENDFSLGQWIQRQRKVYKQKKISNERIDRLTAIGMNWNPDQWESRFDLAKQYYEEHGNINISQKEVIQGVWLGKWIVSQKKAMDSGKLTDHQVQMLKTLPMEEVGRKDNRWWAMYEEAKKYYLKFGNLNIPKDYLTSDGKRLSDWIIRQRRSLKMGKMTSEHKKLLADIGFPEDLEKELEYKKLENIYLKQSHLLKIKVH
ncbi:Helicase associated domain protein [uncultured Catenibacterium sp.]|uniref:Helicase associated domain protein n=1 Tax=uncultured Catenibacterium sp. TaxID=286142 RepID=UPI0025E6B8CD|nr:Helicase associated domain protein [uncultured Catenibacterium sp.]